jgi:hypothetical protein
VNHFDSESRDAYWAATREQLRSAQNRADLFTLLGLAAVCALLWLYHEPGEQLAPWLLAGIGVALVVIGAPLWFVTRHKRRISAMRGLTCKHCGHVPHDTEIFEVANTRQCQSCERPLD